MKNKRRSLLIKYKIIVMCGFAIAAISSIVLFCFNKQNKVNVTGGIMKQGIIPGYTEEEIKAMMQRRADESTFSFEINSRPIFLDGKSEGNLRIANPPYNKYAINVEIKLDESGKTVFKSGDIAPNYYIEKAKLTKKLDKGEYQATATINAYDIETKEFKGTSVAKLVIKVEN
ncbi:MAG: hypothetical protein O7C59_00065 [Rickettsia endosymbiont of Ixodes persulcatus]|nr:hypothetical protein [Rickettsia endosymbiont of Ixodes persulcatus]